MNIVQFGIAGKTKLFIVAEGCTRCGDVEKGRADEKTAGLALTVSSKTWAREVILAVPVCTDCEATLIAEAAANDAA